MSAVDVAVGVVGGAVGVEIVAAIGLALGGGVPDPHDFTDACRTHGEVRQMQTDSFGLFGAFQRDFVLCSDGVVKKVKR